jgi:hypothetical protein
MLLAGCLAGAAFAADESSVGKQAEVSASEDSVKTALTVNERKQALSKKTETATTNWSKIKDLFL